MTAIVRHIEGYDGEITWHIIARYSRPRNLYRVGQRVGQAKITAACFGPGGGWVYDIEALGRRYYQVGESRLTEWLKQLNRPQTALALRPPMSIVVYQPPAKALLVQ